MRKALIAAAVAATMIAAAAVATNTRSEWSYENLTFKDATYSPSASLWERAPQLAALDPATGFTFFDDFFAYDATATVGDWVVATDAGGSQAMTDAAGGVILITNDGDENDETYLASIAESWKPATTKPIFFEARVKLDQVGDAAAFVGLSDTVGANTLVDTNGMAASWDGCGFVKAVDSTYWQFETSEAGDQDTEATLSTFSDATWVRLGFILDYDADTCTPFVDGVAGTAVELQDNANLDEMHILFGLKTDANDGSEELLYVDYVKVLQIR